MKKKEEPQTTEPKILKKRGRKKKIIAFNDDHANDMNNEKEGSRIEDDQFRELKKIKNEEGKSQQKNSQNFEESFSEGEKILEAVEL